VTYEKHPGTSSSGAGIHHIAAAGLGYEVAGNQLLHNVSFTVDRASLVTVVGPNGAGKSTLLGLMAGDLKPTSGLLHIDGRAPQAWNSQQLARVRAVMEQDQQATFGFTVRELVELGRLPQPKSPDDEEIVRRSMSAAQISHLEDRDVTTLSGGELSRTSFARVLAQGASVVLLDEPTAALDLGHQETVMRSARALADRGAIVVAILHDLNQAARHAHRVIMLDQGELVGDGVPRDVLTAQSVSELYGHPVEVLHSTETGTPVIVPK
jgi:iron complex transport system ATP-binding protein